jgi:hypothetical protein
MSATKLILRVAGRILLALLVVGAVCFAVWLEVNYRAQLRYRKDAANKLSQLTPETLIAACGKPLMDEPSGLLAQLRDFDANAGRRNLKAGVPEPHSERELTQLLQLEAELAHAGWKGRVKGRAVLIEEWEQELAGQKWRDIGYPYRSELSLKFTSGVEEINTILVPGRKPSILTFHFEEGKFSYVDHVIDVPANKEWITEVLPCIPSPQ